MVEVAGKDGWINKINQRDRNYTYKDRKTRKRE